MSESQAEQTTEQVTGQTPEAPDVMQQQALAMLESQVKQNDTMQRLMTVMLAARQLYAVGIHVLAEVVQAMPWEPLPPADPLAAMADPAAALPVEDTRQQHLQAIVVNTIAASAGKNFAFETVLRSIRSVAVPWLEAETQVRDQQAKKNYEQQLLHAEKARGSVAIELSIAGKKDTFARSEPVYVIGSRERLRALFDEMHAKLQEREDARSELKHVHQAVILKDFRLAGDSPDESPPAWCHVVQHTDWQQRFSSKTERALLFAGAISPGLSLPIDLLVVEDLFAATRASSGSAAMKSRLNVAAESIWSAVKELHCLTVLGVPLTVTELASAVFVADVVKQLASLGRPCLVVEE